MSDPGAIALAELAEEAMPEGPQSELLFGEVVTASSTAVTVRMDGTDNEIGPFPLLGTPALAALDRAGFIGVRAGGIVRPVACIGKVFV